MNAISYYLVRKFLLKANRLHLERYPQLACHSFDQITTSIHLDGQYERDQLSLLARDIYPILSTREVCLDVGANIGNHSVHFAGHFDKVIAFEPHPRNFALLELNADLTDGRVLPLKLGASSKAGQMEIVEDRTNLGASSLERTKARDGRRVTFELRRIDDTPEVVACNTIGFMKLDIEGHEAEAIQGARETLLKHRPVIMLEVLKEEIDRESGASASLEALRELGYRFFYVPVETGLIGSVPKKLRKLSRTLYSLFTLKRPNSAGKLVPIERLDHRNYLMVLCSTDPLEIGQ